MSRPGFAAAVTASIAMTFGVLFPWTGPAAADDEAGDLDLLTEWMTGTFSSAAQAAEDPEFFDISMHMTPIWTHREDGRWLYVEQAVSEAPDLPYRQRVYRVTEAATGLFESRIYTLPDPGGVIGAWKAETPLDHLSPEDLEEREGCSVLMRRRGDTFIGSTLAWLCSSSLRGASYVTSEVMITADGMITWDRGFAGDHNQVWGSVKGGSVFDRIVDDPDFSAEAAAGSDRDGDDDREETPEEDENETDGDRQPE